MASNHNRRHLQVRASKRVLTCSQQRQARCFSTCCAHTHEHKAKLVIAIAIAWSLREVTLSLSLSHWLSSPSSVQASHCAGMCVRVCACLYVCGCLCVFSYAHLWQSTVWPLTRFVIAHCAVCCGDVVFLLLLSIKCKPKWQLALSTRHSTVRLQKVNSRVVVAGSMRHALSPCTAAVAAGRAEMPIEATFR